MATTLLALVAETVVDTISVVTGSVSEVFIGATVVALVPDIAEIVNGIQFALQNNVALSIEIGSSIAVQVCLLQMPVLVFVSELFIRGGSGDVFTVRAGRVAQGEGGIGAPSLTSPPTAHL